MAVNQGIDELKDNLKHLMDKLPHDVRVLVGKSMNVIKEGATIEERTDLRNQELDKLSKTARIKENEMEVSLKRKQAYNQEQRDKNKEQIEEFHKQRLERDKNKEN
jgi:hypothetical protein